MKNVACGGVVLGLLVAVWTFVMGFTGWYKHPTLLHLFWVVVPMQIGVLVWTLRRSATDGKGYGGQVLTGLGVSLIGGIIAFGSSLLFTTVVFPHYFDELRALHIEMLRGSGQSEAEIQAELASAASSQTPLASASAGLIGTVMTGLLVSLLLGAFLRARADQPRGPEATA